jgi:hypothetical protein
VPAVSARVSLNPATRGFSHGICLSAKCAATFSAVSQRKDPAAAELGRPRALDDVKRREICVLLTAGYPLVAVAEHVGCSRRTISRELARNPEFAERLRRAKIAGELEPLSTIRQAARTNWRAAAWYLERANPQRFGKRNPVLLKPDEVQQTISSMMLEIVTLIKREPLRGLIMRKLMKAGGLITEAVTEHEKYVGGIKPANLKDLPDIPGMMPDEIAELVEYLETEAADQ